MLKRAGHAETPYILGIVEFLMFVPPFLYWIEHGYPPSWKVWVRFALALPTLIFVVFVVMLVCDYFDQRRHKMKPKSQDNNRS